MIERPNIEASGAADLAVAMTAEDVSVRLPGGAPGPGCGTGRGSTGQPVTGSQSPGLALARLRVNRPGALVRNLAAGSPGPGPGVPEIDHLLAARNEGRGASSRSGPPQGRLRYKATGPNKPHAWRHYFASDSLQRLVPITSVSSDLGHASTKVTFDVYAHLC